MKVLIACEESQIVCKAFRERGHDAYSCDVLMCSGGHPEWHLLMDARAVINGGMMRLQNRKKFWIDRWDMIIAHPPCTYLTGVATRHHSPDKTPINWINARTECRIDAMRFFMAFIEADCDKIAVENPPGVMNTAYRKPDQVIHPYMFAESEDEEATKRTCLWLKGLPLLLPKYGQAQSNEEKYGIYPSGRAKDWESTMTGDRPKERSKTFLGIAKAMAEQWG